MTDYYLPSQYDSPTQEVDFLSPSEEDIANQDSLDEEEPLTSTPAPKPTPTITAQNYSDHEPIGFGKHSALTPVELAKKDPQYLIWAIRETGRINCSQELKDYLRSLTPITRKY